LKTKHIFEIARALLLARSKQTLVAAIGVTFSVAFFISLLGFMEGLNTLLDGLVLNRTPHVRLYNDIQPSVNQPIDLDTAYSNYHNFISSIKPSNARKEIYNVESISKKLKSDKRVYGVAPKVTAQVFYNSGNIELNGVINGVDVIQEAKLFNFKDGFFQSGIVEIDKIQSYVSLATCQKLLGKPNNYISDIQIKLHDMSMAPAMAKEYEQLFGVNAEDIQTANAQFETGSSARTIISYAVGIVLLIVAGFGIYNILNMMIYEKMDTIAILKATGFSGVDVKKIFISISLSIGIGGALAGVLFGLLFSVIIDNIPFNSIAVPGVDTYPVDYGILYYSIAVAFAVATTYFAGWFPARKASLVDPVEIIRGK